MAQAKGSRVELAYIEEVTPGVTPAGTWTAVRKNSESIAGSRETLESGELRSDRNNNSSIQGNANVGGDISSELSVGFHDILIASACFATWQGVNINAAVDLSAANADNSINSTTTDFLAEGIIPGCWLYVSGFATAQNNGWAKIVTVTANKITLAFIDLANESAGPAVSAKGRYIVAKTTPRFFSLSKRYRDIGEHITFAGCLVNAMSVSMSPGAIATVGFTINGRTETVETSGLPAEANYPVVDAAFQDPFDSFSGGVLIDNVLNPNMTEFSFSLDNGIQDLFVIGTRGKVGQAEGRINVTGSVSFYFDDLAQYESSVANDNVALDVLVVRGTKFMAFGFPRSKFNLATPAAGDEGPLTASGDFRALYDTDIDGTIIISRSYNYV